DEEIDAWADTRLVIIDECSFASRAQIETIERHARLLKKNDYDMYGGLNMVFAGDFSQLEPPRAAPLYQDGKQCPEFHGFLNAFIELDGRHRFKDDPAYGEMMMRFRNGLPTIHDIRTLNESCLISANHFPPPNTPIAVWTNSARDAINAAMFEEYCLAHSSNDESEVFSGATFVLMDNLEMRDGYKAYKRITSNQVKVHFYTNCGEDDCSTGDMTNGRVDPVLKLYPGCPLMFTQNKDVANGKANGSRVTLERINVKHGELPMVVRLLCGTTIHAYFASQIRSLTVKHVVDDISPPMFEVEVEKWNFKANIVIHEEKRVKYMTGSQLSVISNGVTTGHKLQGCTLRMLAIFELYYGQNWMYVTLSRVTTMKGLYLQKPLDEDLSKYAMSRHMKNMISAFQNAIGLELPTDDEYNKFVNLDRCNRQDRGAQAALKNDDAPSQPALQNDDAQNEPALQNDDAQSEPADLLAAAAVSLSDDED
ncbi:MAG: hypothetical protein ACRCZC_02775, partial [Culicoidibacterales bacterium]